MKDRIFNLIILDESGSMIAIKKYAIDSVNETLQTIRTAVQEHEEQEHFVTLTTFNTEAKTLCDCTSPDKTEELTDDTYLPNGGTALYDVMGMSLTHLRSKVAENDKVLVTIITDGMENSSREYDEKAIKTLVDELKNKGWVFAYIGANHKVEEAASSISIGNCMEFHPDASGMTIMSAKLSRARKRLYDKLAQMKDEYFDGKTANQDFFKED